MSLLGVDVGTTGCKAAAFAADGRCLASAYREYATTSPHVGWAELDSPAVFALVKQAIAAVAAETTDDPITAVGVSSMGEAATPVSADRQILGPSILMSDSRGSEYVEGLRQRIGQREFYAINPNILAASYTMPKLCWLRDHQPDLYARADCFLHWAGLVASGRAVCGIGTYECITPVYGHVPDSDFMLARGLNVEHAVLPRLYVSFLYNQGGSLVRWFRDTFAAAECAQARGAGSLYDALAAEMPAEPTRLLTLPHFDVTGPPHFTSDSAGVICGLSTATTRGEILKSIMESETFYFVESVEGLREMGIDVSEFIATGGGARSDAWLQIKADVFGVPFVRPRVTEAAALGAAMLAGLATGALDSPTDAAARFVHPDRTFHPNPRRHALYRPRAALYRELYPLLKDFLKRAAH